MDMRMAPPTQPAKRNKIVHIRKIIDPQDVILKNSLQCLWPFEENDLQDAKTRRAPHTRDAMHLVFVSSQPELRSRSSRRLLHPPLIKTTLTDDLILPKTLLMSSRLGQEGAVVEQHEEVTVALKPSPVDSIIVSVAKKSNGRQHRIDLHRLGLLRVEDEETSLNRILLPSRLLEHLATLIQRE